MKREAIDSLKKWKNKKDRKPLIIQGARQVGKTWLMKEFGRLEFKQTAYFNFEVTKELHSIFANGFQTQKIINSLNIFCGFNIESNNTLIIFDEIQSCPEAINALKYFQEDSPEYAIMAAGSLLGVAIHQGSSFPVGKVEFMTLYPLNFHEFLMALNKQELLKLLENADEAMIKILSNQFIELLKSYYFIGGMPEVVKSFSIEKNYREAREIQNGIIRSYENDFSKHAPINQVPRIRLVWQSIVAQLAKENSKFVYNLLRTGARAKDFEMALEWLKDAGLIHKVIRVSKPGLPIASYADWSDFKIYFNDIGLLCAMAELNEDILLKEEQLFTEFKGIISEQFVLQHLVNKNYKAYYWNPENARSEIDFLIQKNNQIIPIEVKSSENLTSKSLKVYQEKFNPEISIRTSLSFYKKQDNLENIPLYGFLNWLN
jgi:predicted AAA+ superfamily ATPase